MLELVLGIGAFVVAYMTYLAVDHWRGRLLTRKFPWLFHFGNEGSMCSLYDVEAQVDEGSFVYLITPDLFNDARNTDAIELVKHNLDRRISYRYVTRNDDERTQRNSDLVHKNFVMFGDRVAVYALNELFDQMPTYNVLLIEHDADGQLRVFLELPVRESIKTQARRYLWAEADTDLADR